jgi:hypothetical protein
MDDAVAVRCDQCIRELDAHREDFLDREAGLGYATTDLRLTRRLYLRPRVKVELVGEVFNALNRDNRRVTITDNGFTNTATDFIQFDKAIGIRYFPAYYQRPANLTRATSAYAPRQIQFALTFIF